MINFLLYKKPFGRDAHAAIRKFYRFAVLRRRAKWTSPSRVRGKGVEVGLPTLFNIRKVLPFRKREKIVH